MKKILILIMMVVFVPTLKAQKCVNQYKNNIPSEQNLFLMHPFPEIIGMIGNPDTLFLCHMGKGYDGTNYPVALNLIVYKRNGIWQGTTLQTYKKKGYMEYHLMDTVFLNNLDWGFDSMTEELMKLDASNSDITTCHASIYIKRDSIYYWYLVGSFPDFIDALPELSSFISVCLFETYTTRVIKEYRRDIR